jgi:hypothetical protein
MEKMIEADITPQFFLHGKTTSALSLVKMVNCSSHCEKIRVPVHLSS